jgi:hypothetical protein
MKKAEYATNHRGTRVVGVALTAVVVCLAALSTGPVVTPQLDSLASLGSRTRGGVVGGGGGGGGSSSPSSTSTLGSADYFPETVYLAAGPFANDLPK